MLISVKLASSVLIAISAVSLASCASYNSSCEELFATGRSQLNQMVKDARRASFERHVIMLETGSALSDTCRTHLISGAEFRDLESTAQLYCAAQSTVSDQYCLLYSLDGKLTKQEIYGY